MMQWLHQLPRHWHTSSALTCLLWPLEVLYKIALGLRRVVYSLGWVRTHRLDATVIVVGNVVAGGGGKTPLTIAMVQRLKQQGYKVGVVSRGYGRLSQQIQMVNAESTADQVGDEPLLIFQRCHVPVAVGAKRVDAAQHLLAQHPEVKLIVCEAVAVPTRNLPTSCTNSPGFTKTGASPRSTMIGPACGPCPIAAPTAHVIKPSGRRRGAFAAAASAVASETAVWP